MTIRELIRALEIYDSENEVKLNDFHKGLDDIGVIREVAEGHVEIIRMGYGKEYFEKPLPTDEEIVKEANEIGEKEYWPIGRQTGFVFGAMWMRDLIQERSKK